MTDQIYPEDLALVQSEPKYKSLIKGWIKLNVEISTMNYICSLCHYFVMTFIFVSVESLQPLLFKQQYGIHPKDAGTQNGYILLVDIATKCLFAPIMGILSDKFGRVPILQCGIVLTAVALCMMGYSTNLYPQYCISRIVYAIGAITLATIPFVADYVHDDTKGRASALNVVLAALGAVFSATVITNLLTQNLVIQLAYCTIGVTFLLLGILYTLGLKRGLHFKEQKRSIQQSIVIDINQDVATSICPYKNYIIMKDMCQDDMDYIDYESEVAALQAIKDTPHWSNTLKIAMLAGSNIWIFQGYVTNFLGRGDSILLTLSLQIWSQQFVEEGLDGDEAFKQANIKAQTLSGVTYTVVMLFAIVYGILFEKTSKNVLLMTMFTLTMTGCFLMNFAPSPNSVFTFIIMGILGSGMSGLYTGALYLVNKYAYTEFRGYITGVANVFSVLGILVCSLLGGLLQDNWSKVAPFNLFGCMSLLGLILVVWSYFYLYQRKKK